MASSSSRMETRFEASAAAVWAAALALAIKIGKQMM
jgi:hypothetical protein